MPTIGASGNAMRISPPAMITYCQRIIIQVSGIHDYRLTPSSLPRLRVWRMHCLKPKPGLQSTQAGLRCGQLVLSRTGGDGRAKQKSCRHCWPAETARLGRCRSSKRYAKQGLSHPALPYSLPYAHDMQLPKGACITCEQQHMPDLPAPLHSYLPGMQVHCI